MNDEIKSLFDEFKKKETKDEPKVEGPKIEQPVEEPKSVEPEPKPVEPKPVGPKPIEPKPEPKPIPVAKVVEEFDLSPAQPGGKHIIMIFGLKGGGKTSLAFSFPETHGCISFDNKSLPIAEQTGKNEKIFVFDGSRYMDKTSAEAWLESADKTWRYLNKLLDSIPKDKIPDWMVVDGGEIFHQVAEMVMRYRNNLMPFQGISNKNIWKERRMYIDQLLRKCLSKSKKGVIWTSYIDKDEVVQDGDFITKVDVPRWIDAVMTETDVVIKVERATDKTGQKFFATIESSKWKVLPESAKTDVTGDGIKKLAKGEI